MVAHVIRLGPVATTFVALMIPPCASLPWRPFELAFPLLEAEAQGFVLSIMGAAAILEKVGHHLHQILSHDLWHPSRSSEFSKACWPAVVVPRGA